MAFMPGMNSFRSMGAVTEYGAVHHPVGCHGNDENVFGGLVTACAIASAAERQTTGSISGSPCKKQYRGSFRQKVQKQTYPNVIHALEAVRKAAPRATVAILGYPRILPQTGVPACYSSVPISMGDVPYLDRTQRVLNRVIERAAKKTGVEFVDMSRISVGHDACQPIGTRWMSLSLAPGRPACTPTSSATRRWPRRP